MNISRGELTRELSAQRHQKKLKLPLPLQFDQGGLVQGILLANPNSSIVTYPLRELNPCLRREKPVSLPLDERDKKAILSFSSKWFFFFVLFIYAIQRDFICVYVVAKSLSLLSFLV